MIAIASRVPLFVEAMRAVFDGIADLQTVSVDDVELQGLVRAFRPDALIVEGIELDVIDVIDLMVPCVCVELKTLQVSIRNVDGWESLQVELSPEAIRNVAVAALYGGDAS